MRDFPFTRQIYPVPDDRFWILNVGLKKFFLLIDRQIQENCPCQLPQTFEQCFFKINQAPRRVNHHWFIFLTSVFELFADLCDNFFFKLKIQCFRILIAFRIRLPHPFCEVQCSFTFLTQFCPETICNQFITTVSAVPKCFHLFRPVRFPNSGHTYQSKLHRFSFRRVKKPKLLA